MQNEWRRYTMPPLAALIIAAATLADLAQVLGRSIRPRWGDENEAACMRISPTHAAPACCTHGMMMRPQRRWPILLSS
jgi:hypothetical protein